MAKTTARPDLVILCGEKSGDIQAATILRKLRETQPTLSVSGIGGEALRQVGYTELSGIESFSIIGCVDILKKAPQLLWQFRKIRNYLLKYQPPIILMIDNAEFHLHLAHALKKRGCKSRIIQYVCPSVWAWRPERKARMEKSFDEVIALFPFEKKHFATSPLPVHHFGHPLIEAVRNHTYKPFDPLKGEKPLVALFPGSRMRELRAHLPLQLNALKSFPQYQPAIGVAHDRMLPEIARILKKTQQKALLIPASHRYELMKTCHFALAKVGTVTLELGLHCTPTITMYRLPYLEEWLARRLFKILLPHYCIVNILAKRRILPELIGPLLTPQNLEQEIAHLQEPRVWQECQSRLKNLCAELPNTNAIESLALHLNGSQ